MQEILLVEDSDDDADLLARTLHKAGVNNPVVRIRDGAEASTYLAALEQAFESAKPPVPSVLLLDLKLPGLNGLDLLERLQFRRAFQKSLRVIFTEISNTETIKRAYSLGAHSFLTKPVSVQDMYELIKTYPAYWLVGTQSNSVGPG